MNLELIANMVHNAMAITKRLMTMVSAGLVHPIKALTYKLGGASLVNKTTVLCAPQTIHPVITQQT